MSESIWTASLIPLLTVGLLLVATGLCIMVLLNKKIIPIADAGRKDTMSTAIMSPWNAEVCIRGDTTVFPFRFNPDKNGVDDSGVIIARSKGYGDITIPNNFVSNPHIGLYLDQKGPFLQVHSKTNKVYHNNRPITELDLVNGLKVDMAGGISIVFKENLITYGSTPKSAGDAVNMDGSGRQFVRGVRHERG
ncbi:hypothetical protein RFF05_13230 [Bengtsoniella intestinalis]|uniref:hypothetical protein n=1 Tax=Bengtsoniella intestinalis TaxID=3073143 RepID=UPI00391EECCB